MTNCVRCGSEIPVKDIVAGNYRKVEGNPYHSNCAAAAEPAKATVASSAAARTTSSSASKSSSSSSRSGSSASISRPSSASRSSASSSSSRIARPTDDNDGDEEERPRGYVKKEDPTLKYAGIVGGILILIAAIVAVYTFTSKHNKDAAAATAWSNSSNAVAVLQSAFTSKTEDSQIDELEKLIAQYEPAILDEHRGELNNFKTQLQNRKDGAKQRKEFAGFYEYIKTNVNDASKAEDVKKALDKADKLMGFATDNQKKDMATYIMLNNVAILEAHYQKAQSVRDKNPDNWPLICEAFTEAEEWFTGYAQSLIRSKVPGAERAKELYELIQGQTNLSADSWATSDKYGFKTVTPINLLDQSKEFIKNDSHWTNTPAANWKLEGGKLVITGLPFSGTGEMRAGMVAWAPSSKLTTMPNSEDILPGTKEIMRNYEVTMKFKVIKKGFTILSRHAKGYQRHSYGIETNAAQEERKTQSKKAKEQGKLGPAANPNDPFNDPTPGAAASATETNFPVEEGKTYEVTVQVYGKTIKIIPKEAGAADPDPLEDSVRARYGGIGFWVLPGAQVEFETLSVKILN